jgi:hypothetical protein
MASSAHKQPEETGTVAKWRIAKEDKVGTPNAKQMESTPENTMRRDGKQGAMCAGGKVCGMFEGRIPVEKKNWRRDGPASLPTDFTKATIFSAGAREVVNAQR